MFNLIPISLLITAIGGIVYIVSNHLSEFDSDEKSSDSFKFNFKARFVDWANQLPLDNIKSQSLLITQKLLHRFRLTLLKTDNHLMKLIGKISEQDKIINGNGVEKKLENNDFWQDLSRNKQELEGIVPESTSEVKIEFVSKNMDNSKKIEKFFDIQPAKKTLKIKKSSK